jgi:hypothetical protein
MPLKRLNSGRVAEHHKCEDFRQIDIRRLARDGYLSKFHALRWGWEPGSWIDLQTDPDEVRLTYRYRRNGGDWRDVDQRVAVVRTNCGYGSRGRPWFECPTCRRRCAILYLITVPYCRRCGDLRYASQSDGETNRSWGRTHKIEAKLAPGGGGWNYLKPRYMHWKTFHRLTVRWREEMIIRDQQLEAALLRLRSDWT